MTGLLAAMAVLAASWNVFDGLPRGLCVTQTPTDATIHRCRPGELDYQAVAGRLVMSCDRAWNCRLFGRPEPGLPVPSGDPRAPLVCPGTKFCAVPHFVRPPARQP